MYVLYVSIRLHYPFFFYSETEKFKTRFFFLKFSKRSEGYFNPPWSAKIKKMCVVTNRLLQSWKMIILIESLRASYVRLILTKNFQNLDWPTEQGKMGRKSSWILAALTAVVQNPSEIWLGWADASFSREGRRGAVLCRVGLHTVPRSHMNHYGSSTWP